MERNSIELSCDVRPSAFLYYELRILVKDYYFNTWNATAPSFDDRARMPRFLQLYQIHGIANRVASNPMEYRKYPATIFSSSPNEKEAN